MSSFIETELKLMDYDELWENKKFSNEIWRFIW